MPETPCVVVVRSTVHRSVNLRPADAPTCPSLGHRQKMILVSPKEVRKPPMLIVGLAAMNRKEEPMDAKKRPVRTARGRNGSDETIEQLARERPTPDTTSKGCAVPVAASPWAQRLPASSRYGSPDIPQTSRGSEVAAELERTSVARLDRSRERVALKIATRPSDPSTRRSSSRTPSSSRSVCIDW